MAELLQHLAAPEDRVLFALLALVLGYALIAVVLRRRDPTERTGR
jgi:hypothetical protein